MADEASADDLRSILSKSFDDAMSSTAIGDGVVKPEVVADPAPKVEAAAEVEPKAGDDRPRGEDGKFLKKEAAEKDETEPKDKEPKADPKADEPKPDADKDKPEPKAVDSKEDAISKWSASDKAMFRLQSPEAQDFLLRRHKAMEADYTKKTAAIASLKTEYEPVQQLFAPYVDVLKQKGLTPQTVIRRWADVETALANGRGVDIIDGIVKSYGIDKATLAQRLGFTSGRAIEPGTDPTKAAAADPAHPTGTASPAPIELPPQVAEEIRQLRARLDAREQTEQQTRLQTAQQREAAVESEITTFKSATNDRGEALHPYFEEVEPAMIALASSYVASKQPIPKLNELYETAVWANPSTRAALLASQKAAEQAKATEEARAKAASARKAGSSVTGAPGSGQATRQVRAELSLREQLEEAAAELG